MAETFAVAFETVARYDPERGEPGAWLFGIARNILARSLKRGRVEDETRRRLGMPVLIVDDDALERVEALASQDGPALAASKRFRAGCARRFPGASWKNASTESSPQRWSVLRAWSASGCAAGWRGSVTAWRSNDDDLS